MKGMKARAIIGNSIVDPISVYNDRHNCRFKTLTNTMIFLTGFDVASPVSSILYTLSVYTKYSVNYQ